MIERPSSDHIRRSVPPERVVSFSDGRSYKMTKSHRQGRGGCPSVLLRDVRPAVRLSSSRPCVRGPAVGVSEGIRFGASRSQAGEARGNLTAQVGKSALKLTFVSIGGLLHRLPTSDRVSDWSSSPQRANSPAVVMRGRSGRDRTGGTHAVMVELESDAAAFHRVVAISAGWASPKPSQVV